MKFSGPLSSALSIVLRTQFDEHYFYTTIFCVFRDLEVIKDKFLIGYYYCADVVINK